MAEFILAMKRGLGLKRESLGIRYDNGPLTLGNEGTACTSPRAWTPRRKTSAVRVFRRGSRVLAGRDFAPTVEEISLPLDIDRVLWQNTIFWCGKHGEDSG